MLGMEEECQWFISFVEVLEAVRRIKGGKPAVEYMKKGDREVIEWFVRMFNGCWKDRRVPEEWKKACIVPLYKGKGDRF